MAPSIPQTRDLVLIGGGHTHALLLKSWAMQPLSGVRITLIDPSSATAYSGMLPGFVAGHYQREDLDIDLVRLSRHAGARFVQGAAHGLDLVAKTVAVAGRPPIRYDIASIDIGVHSQLSGIEGVTEHAAAVKPLGRFASAWSDFLEKERSRPAAIVVIGGGVAGVEIALAMAYRIPDALITIVDQASEPLRELAGRERKALMHALHMRKVRIKTDHGVIPVSKTGVVLPDGVVLPADFVVSAAGAAPHSWLAETGLAHDEGFICVDEFLNSTSDPSVFAVGDCAQMVKTPRQKAGVFAVRQAPVLLNNLRAALGDGQMTAYRPQSDYLKLVSTGSKSA
ncbi:MAG: FAD-dependent oxidoreductase, partial [Henriciella sp.]|nr:FAD-dependent oxidoreductase [Henriciella sp.]